MTFQNAYGFDDIALAPSDQTIDESDVDISINLAGIHLDIPIIASAMDSVCSPEFIIQLGKLGATGVLNLEGVHGRYSEPDSVLAKIAQVSNADYVSTMQAIYQKEGVKPELITACIQRIKAAGVPVIVSSTPQQASKLGAIAAAAGADAFVIQSTVISNNFLSRNAE